MIGNKTSWSLRYQYNEYEFNKRSIIEAENGQSE